jgi:hypothetical protein
MVWITQIALALSCCRPKKSRFSKLFLPLTPQTLTPIPDRPHPQTFPEFSHNSRPFPLRVEGLMRLAPNETGPFRVCHKHQLLYNLFFKDRIVDERLTGRVSRGREKGSSFNPRLQWRRAPPKSSRGSSSINKKAVLMPPWNQSKAQIGRAARSRIFFLKDKIRTLKTE